MSTKALHIGYDAKRAFANHTGLGHYSRNLLVAMAKYYPEHHYHLYAPKVPKSGIEPLLQTAPFTMHHPQGWVNETFPSLWRSVRLGRQLKSNGLQLYHGLSNELPVDISKSGVRSVVTIHDLIFLDHPELYPAIDRQIYRAKSSMACEKADHIIAISEQTKQSIIQHFGIPANKITVVYQSCNPVFLETPSKEHLAQVKAHYQLPEWYLLYVGSIAERKQTLQLVQAFHALNQPNLKLVLVGNGGSYKQKVLQYVITHQLTDRVLFLQNIPTEDLPSIYRQALAVVYPSLMEGFGIPIIEAIHSGTPVITTAGGCFEEAGGDAAKYVPAGDVPALTNAFNEVTQSAELRQQMIAKGSAHARNFTPKTFADGVMGVYERVLQNGNTVRSKGAQ